MKITMLELQADKYKQLRTFIRCHTTPLSHKVDKGALRGVWRVSSIRKVIKQKLEMFANDNNRKKSRKLWNEHLELLKEFK